MKIKLKNNSSKTKQPSDKDFISIYNFNSPNLSKQTLPIFNTTQKILSKNQNHKFENNKIHLKENYKDKDKSLINESNINKNKDLYNFSPLIEKPININIVFNL